MSFVISVHGSIVFLLVVSFFKYGDRTELVERGLRGTDSVLAEMRRRVTSELVDLIGSYLRLNHTLPTISLEDVPAYIEKVKNPAQSEGFREKIKSYVEEHSQVLADCTTLQCARTRWCFWARFLSWNLLILLIIEGVIGLFWVGFVVIFEDQVVPIWASACSFIPFLCMSICIALALWRKLYNHDIMIEHRVRYDEF